MRTTSQLHVVSLMLSLIPRLRPVVDAVRCHDRSLADQLRRAASSVAANLAEGDASSAGTKRARYENALGSARETRTHLAMAAAWGYVDEATREELDGELDRVCAMTFRLLRR